MKNKKGFSLVEVLMAIAISVTLFGSMVAAFVAVKSVNMMARHKIQAVQVVRGQIENMKSTPFSTLLALPNSTQVPFTTYDTNPGPDGVNGNADDINMQGTMTTTIQDFMDFDGDGNTTETRINVDNIGGNDDLVAVPVRVSLAWTEYMVGQTKNMSVSVDTIITS